MKKTNMKRIMTFLLAMVIAATTIVTVSPSNVQAAETRVYLWVDDYNDTVVAKEGEKYTDLVKRLQPVVKVRENGKVKYASYTVKEAGQFVHAKKGKVNVTFIYKDVETSLSVKVKVTTKKLSVKAIGKLYEQQKLTISDLKKAIKVRNFYSDGTKVANFRGYGCRQIGKVVKANKKGYKKITISNGKKKASVKVKVDPLQRIYYEKTLDSLPEGTAFDETAFRNGSIIKGQYKGGAKKVLNTYSVSAAPTVTGTTFPVTVTCGKFTLKLSIPVVKKPVDPTPVKKVTASVSVEGEGTATANGKSIETVKAGTKVTFEAFAAENFEFKAWKLGDKIVSTDSIYTVPVTENITLIAVFEKIRHIVTFKNPTTNSVRVNGSALHFVDGVSMETFEVGTEIKIEISDSNTDRFVRCINESNGETLSTEKSFLYTVEEDVTIAVVFENTCTFTITRNGGKGKAFLDGEEMDFYSNVAEKNLVPGTYTLVVQGTDDYDLVNLTNSSGLEITPDREEGNSKEYTISIASDTTVTANFAEAGKTVMVTYQYDSGSIINSQAVVFGDSLVPPTNVFKKDHSFKGWKIENVLYEGDVDSSEFYHEEETLSEAIKTLTAAQQDVTVVAYFEKNPVYYSVTISGTGATLKDAAGNELNPNEILSGTHVYIDAIVPDGQVFNYLRDVDNDIIVTYRERYDFFIGSNRNFEVVCSEEEVPAEPKVLLRGEGYTAVSPNLSVLTTIDLPAGYSNLEWGVVFCLEEKADFQYDTEGVFKVQDTDKKVIHSTYADSSITLQDSAMFDNHMVMWVRAYARIQSSSGTQTIYSRIVKIQL